MARGAGVALVTLVALAIAGPTAAATLQHKSQKIFADLADNGRLDGHYTRAEIDRALHSPSLKKYEPRPHPVSQPQATAPAVITAAGDTRGSVPFSGLDLALFGGVGGPLLLIGASLGRVARVRADGELGQ